MNDCCFSHHTGLNGIIKMTDSVILNHSSAIFLPPFPVNHLTASSSSWHDLPQIWQPLANIDIVAVPNHLPTPRVLLVSHVTKRCFLMMLTRPLFH